MTLKQIITAELAVTSWFFEIYIPLARQKMILDCNLDDSLIFNRDMLLYEMGELWASLDYQEQFCHNLTVYQDVLRRKYTEVYTQQKGKPISLGVSMDEHFTLSLNSKVKYRKKCKYIVSRNGVELGLIPELHTALKMQLQLLPRVIEEQFTLQQAFVVLLMPLYASNIFWDYYERENGFDHTNSAIHYTVYGEKKPLGYSLCGINYLKTGDVFVNYVGDVTKKKYTIYKFKDKKNGTWTGFLDNGNRIYISVEKKKKLVHVATGPDLTECYWKVKQQLDNQIKHKHKHNVLTSDEVVSLIDADVVSEDGV